MKNLIKAMVVDDEPLAINRIAKLLNEIDEINLVNESNSGEEAIKYLSSNTPDLIFMDIDLNLTNGFEVLSRINDDHNPYVVFVTAHKEFALKAFNYFAFDYLLKPYKDERFFNSVNRIIKLYNNDKSYKESSRIDQLIDYVESQNFENLNVQAKKIPFKYNDKIVLLDSNSILYILASGTYCEVCISERKYLIRESLKQLSNRLPKRTFFRVHRSTIINLNLIEEIIISNYREIDVKMKDSQLFRVGAKYKEELLKIVNLTHD